MKTPVGKMLVFVLRNTIQNKKNFADLLLTQHKKPPVLESLYHILEVTPIIKRFYAGIYDILIEMDSCVSG